jgi:hypothetical protein
MSSQRAATPPAEYRERRPTQPEPGEVLHPRVVTGTDVLARLAITEQDARARGDRLGLRLIAERKLAAHRQLHRRRRCRLIGLAVDRRARSERR